MSIFWWSVTYSVLVLGYMACRRRWLVRPSKRHQIAGVTGRRFTPREMQRLGTPAHTDEYGTLWQFWSDSWVIKVVEVVDSTPDKRGRRRHYWLRVHPDVRTAHAAVASTFRETEHSYHPLVET